MEDILLNFFNGLQEHPYLLVLVALCFEFVPAELVLPLTGSWVETYDLNVHLLALLGGIGGTIGPITLFWLSEWKGREVVIKYGKWFLINKNHIESADNFFNKYGSAVAFFARFMPVVRTAISVPCGLAAMNAWKFTIYTFLAMYPITYVYLWLGIKLGEHWDKAGDIFSRYSIWFAIAFVVVIIGIVILKKGLRKKKQINITKQ